MEPFEDKTVPWRNVDGAPVGMSVMARAMRIAQVLAAVTCHKCMNRPRNR